MAEKQAKAEAPPYVAFRTLWNFLDRLGEVGTPPRIDRSVWSDQMSGGYGAQLMAALRFLKLIDSGGNAHPDLKMMAEDKEFRKPALWHRLDEAYKPVLEKLDLSQATMAQLQEQFRATYSVSGETFNKAISFFTHAAQAAGVTLSPYIERSMKRRTTTGKPRAKRRSKKPAQKPGQGVETPAADGSDAHERIVALRSGGTVKLSLDYNAFKLTNEDRAFVFGLIDAVQQYESGGEAVE